MTSTYELCRKSGKNNMIEIDNEVIIEHLSVAVGHTVNNEQLNASVYVSIVGDRIEINALARKEEESYLIGFTPGCFGCIQTFAYNCLNELPDSIFERYLYTQNDNYFRLMDDSTPKNEFINHICLECIDSILFHEFGHIICGHCDDGAVLSENGETRLGYEHQVLEMCADHFSAFKTIAVNLYAYEDFSRCEELFDQQGFFFAVVRREFVSAIVSQCLLFYSFQFESSDKDFSEADFENRSHPHPYVRLLYSIDYIVESLRDLVMHQIKCDESEAMTFIDRVVDDSLDDIKSFLSGWFLDDFNTILNDEALENVYHTLRSHKYLDTIPYEYKTEAKFLPTPID